MRPFFKHLPRKHNQALHGNRINSVSISGLDKAEKTLQLLRRSGENPASIIKKLTGLFGLSGRRFFLNNKEQAVYKSLGFSVDVRGELEKDDVFYSAEEAFAAMSAWQSGGNGAEQRVSKKVKKWMDGKSDTGLDLIWALNQAVMPEGDITLYRGMSVSPRIRSLIDARASNSKEIDMGVVSHWSSNPAVARGFSFDNSGSDASEFAKEVLFRIRVPKKSILWSYKLGGDGFAREKEYMPMFSAKARVSRVSDKSIIELEYQTKSD